MIPNNTTSVARGLVDENSYVPNVAGPSSLNTRLLAVPADTSRGSAGDGDQEMKNFDGDAETKRREAQSIQQYSSTSKVLKPLLSENSQSNLHAMEDPNSRAAQETVPESASPKKSELPHCHKMPAFKDIILTDTAAPQVKQIKTSPPASIPDNESAVNDLRANEILQTKLPLHNANSQVVRGLFGSDMQHCNQDGPYLNGLETQQLLLSNGTAPQLLKKLDLRIQQEEAQAQLLEEKLSNIVVKQDNLATDSPLLLSKHSPTSQQSGTKAPTQHLQQHYSREQRACNKERKNYSQVHKGLLQPLSSEHQQTEELQQQQESTVLQINNEKQLSQPNQSPTQQVIQKKRQTYSDIQKLFAQVTSFDWDLKDIKNLKQSPEALFTPIVFWFWLNSQYFPFDAQFAARDQDFEVMFQTSILDFLSEFQTDEKPIKSLDHLEDDFLQLEAPLLDQDPLLVQKLYIEELWLKWRDFCQTDKGQSKDLLQIEECLNSQLTAQSNQNKQASLQLFQTFTQTFNSSEQNEYSSAYVDPHYCQDILQNLDWYIQHYTCAHPQYPPEILLNINYPSKTEKEFLKQLELWQQEKNDVNYKCILKQLQAQERVAQDLPQEAGSQLAAAETRWQQLSAHKRGLVVQEDAQCAICNNGDYEDEDLIVFCGVCNIPVHQRCYGIDEVPENDWICNNCSCLAFKRGLQIRCILCPKRGGAMKPTSVFSSYEHYQRYHKAAAKKKGLNSTTFSLQLQDKQDSVHSVCPNKGPISKAQLFEREDKNHALSQILNRECNFQDALILAKRQSGESFPQEEVPLHFLQTESVNESPEDYDFFLQRNQKILDTSVPTETLYEWVHLSCAMWIPGPIVTPKTPVRLNKIDHKRFGLQCIICGLKTEGACIQCQFTKCKISFHIECARRANYFMEVERVDRERSYRIFCEKHRPLKIVKEQEERDRQAVDEVFKFARVVEKCLDINKRVQQKVIKVKKQTGFTKVRQTQQTGPQIAKPPQIKAQKQMTAKQAEKQERLMQQYMRECERQKQLEQKREAKQARQMQVQQQRSSLQSKKQLQKDLKQSQQPKKWREKDKLSLLEQVKTKYLQLLKLRLNLQQVDPQTKFLRQQERTQKRQKHLLQQEERKRAKKAQLKQQDALQPDLQKTTGRDGLRKRTVRESNLSELQKPQEQIEPVEQEAFTENNEPTVCKHEKRADEGTQQAGGDAAPYFKFGNPMYLQELDWGITLSKYEFPWQDICTSLKSQFSARECYDKYISVVRDPQTFLKKVLNQGQSVLKDKYVKLMQNQMNQPPRLVTIAEQPFGAKGSSGQGEGDLFCVCKGSNMSGFFVACDSGETDCQNGGWLHPECTDELKNLARDAIDNMGAWYCADCRQRMHNEEQEDLQLQQAEEAEEANNEEEERDLRELEAEVEAGKLAIQQMEQELQVASDDDELIEELDYDQEQGGDQVASNQDDLDMMQLQVNGPSYYEEEIEVSSLSINDADDANLA